MQPEEHVQNELERLQNEFEELQHEREELESKIDINEEKQIAVKAKMLAHMPPTLRPYPTYAEQNRRLASVRCLARKNPSRWAPLTLPQYFQECSSHPNQIMDIILAESCNRLTAARLRSSRPLQRTCQRPYWLSPDVAVIIMARLARDCPGDGFLLAACSCVLLRRAAFYPVVTRALFAGAFPGFLSSDRAWTQGNSEIHGRGVFAKQAIQRGSAIALFEGDMGCSCRTWNPTQMQLPFDDWRLRGRQSPHDHGFILDPSALEGDVAAQCVNHSCAPNMIAVWLLFDELRDAQGRPLNGLQQALLRNPMDPLLYPDPSVASFHRVWPWRLTLAHDRARNHSSTHYGHTWGPHVLQSGAVERRHALADSLVVFIARGDIVKGAELTFDYDGEDGIMTNTVPDMRRRFGLVELAQYASTPLPAAWAELITQWGGPRRVAECVRDDSDTEMDATHGLARYRVPRRPSFDSNVHPSWSAVNTGAVPSNLREEHTAEAPGLACRCGASSCRQQFQSAHTRQMHHLQRIWNNPAQVLQ